MRSGTVNEEDLLNSLEHDDAIHYIFKFDILERIISQYAVCIVEITKVTGMDFLKTAGWPR